jgi:hypothetical protein
MKNKVIDLFGNNNVIPKTGVKYSVLLEQFLTPFINEFKDYKYTEDIIEFAINAWNLGNIKTLTPPEEFDKTRKDIPKADIDVQLLNKMIDFKDTKFKEHENFIVDFELEEVDNGDPILRVITQEKEAYLANMINAIEKPLSYSEEDFEENYINRVAIILKPKQPFIDWYSNLYPDDVFEEEMSEPNIYLSDNNIYEIEKWLKKKFDKFFMLELEEWHDNKKEWPQKRNYKMFKLWFRVEIAEMIYDLEKKPILKVE